MEMISGANDSIGISTDEDVVSAFQVFSELFPRDRRVVVEFIRELKNFQAHVEMGH